MHHWGCRLASLHRGSSNPGCPWAPKPYVHLLVQRLALGSPLQRSSRGRAATCLHEKTRLARVHGSLSLGTYDAQTSCIPLKRYKMAYLSCETHNSFWEVSRWPTTTVKENAPVEEQGLALVRTQYVLVERFVWAWEHMIIQMSWPLLTLNRMEYWFRGVWEAASASLVLIHSYPWPHVLVASMVTLASVADPRLFDPRVGDDKAYITTMACNRHLSIVELSHATREAG